MNAASRFRLRQGSQPSGMGVTAGSLSGFMPASGGITGDGVFASGLVEPEALQGTAQDRLSALAGLNAAPQFTPFVAPATAPVAAPAPVYDAPLAPAEGSNVSNADSFGMSADDNSAGMGDAGVGDAGAGDGDSGYMDGGYTGHGHPAEPAGTVHKGEVVIPAEMVARYGLRPLMALVEGQVPPSRLAALAGR